VRGEVAAWVGAGEIQRQSQRCKSCLAVRSLQIQRRKQKKSETLVLLRGPAATTSNAKSRDGFKVVEEPPVSTHAWNFNVRACVLDKIWLEEWNELDVWKAI
jgi:hypothetical protein